MIKFSVIELVVLACVFVVIVSGAQEVQAAIGVHGHWMHAQRQEKEADKCVAQENHLSAARYYARAANSYYAHARHQKTMGDSKGRDESRARAAAMRKAADEQVRMHSKNALVPIADVDGQERSSAVDVAGSNADMESHREQASFHDKAAFQFRRMAEKHAVNGKSMQAHALNMASAEQYKASAMRALASCDYENAAIAYSLSSDRYRAAGDLDKARAMDEVAAREYAAHGVQIARGDDGDRAGAVHSFRRAIKAYEASGSPEKARATSEAMTRLHEDGALRPNVHGSPWHAAYYHRNVADAYEALEQPEKAEAMRRAAAEIYEAEAVELEKRHDAEAAIYYYTEAAEAYKTIGEQKKAESMSDAAIGLETA